MSRFLLLFFNCCTKYVDIFKGPSWIFLNGTTSRGKIGHIHKYMDLRDFLVYFSLSDGVIITSLIFMNLRTVKWYSYLSANLCFLTACDLAWGHSRNRNSVLRMVTSARVFHFLYDTVLVFLFCLTGLVPALFFNSTGSCSSHSLIHPFDPVLRQR